jgi:hypothetical protein
MANSSAASASAKRMVAKGEVPQRISEIQFALMSPMEMK